MQKYFLWLIKLQRQEHFYAILALFSTAKNYNFAHFKALQFNIFLIYYLKY